MNIDLCGEILETDGFLHAIGDEQKIDLSINSPGGDSTAALAIYDALQGRDVKVTITGRCYSAAVTVAMAGRVIRIHPGARMMLHQPALHVFGDSEEVRFQAKFLDKLTARIIGIVAARTRQPLDQVKLWYGSGVDTYFTAAEALDAGLADAVLPEEPQRPGKDLSIVPAAPARAPFTDKERLLFDCFRALGPITTHDRARLHRELSVWLAHSVREET